MGKKPPREPAPAALRREYPRSLDGRGHRPTRRRAARARLFLPNRRPVSAGR